MYVVATPIIVALTARRWPSRGVLIALPLAVAFGGQIVLTDHATRRADPLGITFTMLLFAAVETAIALVVVPGGLATLRPAFLSAAFSDLGFVVPVLLCATVATVLAVSLLNRWQKEADPSRAGVLYTGEPVCAALISVAAGYDRVGGWLLFGAGMILLANLAAELIGRRRRPAGISASSRRS